MNEAELTEQLLTTTGMVFNVTSVVFGIISAYVIGLYWFLHKSSWVLRLTAFLTLTFALSILGVAIFGVMRHSAGVTEALQELSRDESLTALGRRALEPTASTVSVLITSGVGLLGGFIYLGLAYLTFSTGWVKSRIN